MSNELNKIELLKWLENQNKIAEKKEAEGDYAGHMVSQQNLFTIYHIKQGDFDIKPKEAKKK